MPLPAASSQHAAWYSRPLLTYLSSCHILLYSKAVHCSCTGAKQFGLGVGLVLNTSGNCYPASLNSFYYSREYLGFVPALAEAGKPASIPELAKLKGALSLY